MYALERGPFDESRANFLYSFSILGFVTWNHYAVVARKWVFLPVMLFFILAGSYIGYRLDTPEYSFGTHLSLSIIRVAFLGGIGALTYWGWRDM